MSGCYFGARRGASSHSLNSAACGRPPFKANSGESKYSDLFQEEREESIVAQHGFARESGRASLGKFLASTPRSIGSASESSAGLMGSERVRRHPHHRD